MPTSPRSADLPSGEAEAEGGRVKTSLCFIASNKALQKALHKALRKALHKVLHKALHKAL